MKTSSLSVQIIFVIPPFANMFDCASAAQVFHEANEQGLEAEVRFCSFEENIKSSTGIPLGKLELYDNYLAQKGDYIFITSADIHRLVNGKLKVPKAFLLWLTSAYQSGAHICAICNGALILGKTGLLDGRNCTTHWKRTETLRQQVPLAHVHDNLIYVEDNGIITSAGATSGVDVALHVLSRLKDDYFTAKVCRELVIYGRRNGNSPQQNTLLQYRSHVHTGIHKVQDWLQYNLDKGSSISDLAEIAMMSDRNFTRVFKKEIGITVNDYVNTLRKEKIKELLQNPDISREQIAGACGLRSVRHLSRLIQPIKQEI